MRNQQPDYQNVELQVYSMLSRKNVTENRIVEQNQKSRRDNCEQLPYHRTSEQEIKGADAPFIANILNKLVNEASVIENSKKIEKTKK